MIHLIPYLILTFLSHGCSHRNTKIQNKTSLANISKPQKPKNIENIGKKQIERHLKKANALVKDGLYREALSEYKEVLSIDKKEPVANKMIGIIFVKTGDYKNAIKRLERATSMLPDDFDINFYLAESYRTQDRYGDAIFRYKLALSQKPSSVNTLKALAWSYYKIRYYKAALSTSLKLVKKRPRDVQVNIILARVLNRLDKAPKALAILKKVAGKTNKNERPYLLSVMGDVLYSTGQLDEAANTYKSALKDQPLLAGALLGLAKINLERDQRPDLAIALLERAGRIKPSLVETFFYLGKAHQESKPKLSRRYLKKFNKLANGDPEYGEQITESRQIIKKMRSTIR